MGNQSGLFTWLPLMVSLLVTNFVFFSHYIVSRVGTGIELCQFLRIFLLTFVFASVPSFSSPSATHSFTIGTNYRRANSLL